MPPPVFRPITPDDVKEVVTLLTALAEEEGDCCRLTPSALLAQMQQGAPELIGYVATTNDQIIGCSIAYPGYDVLSSSRGLHLSDIYVNMADRRKGIGRGLVLCLAQTALSRDMRWMSWTALSSNKAAKSFYHKLKAVDVEVDFMAIGHKGLRELCDQ